MKKIIIIFFLLSLHSHLRAAANNPHFIDPMDSTFSQRLLERLHFISYFHLRYSFIDNDPGNKVNEDHWSLRRFKLLANWTLSNRLQFFSQFIYKTNNYSGTDDRVYLQHAFMKLLFIKQLNFKIGQFKPPFGWERFQSDFKIPVIERSQAIDRLIPNGSLGESFVRDYGFQFFGKLLPGLRYEAAIMEGSGAHTKLSDKNAPLIDGRLSFNKKFREPIFHKNVELTLQLAHSRRWNGDNNFTKQLPGCDKNMFRHFNGRDNRFDYAIAVNTRRSQFAAEYIAAEYLPDGNGQAKNRANGWFLEHSYFLTKKLQHVVRFEQFDPNQGKKDSHDLSWLTLGLDYYFNNNHGRVMMSYVVKKEATDELKNNMVIVQLQYFLLGK